MINLFRNKLIANLTQFSRHLVWILKFFICLYFCCKLRECQQPLGMENRNISDSQITASSSWDNAHKPYFARLNNQKTSLTIGAWHPAGESNFG